jgi:hypothetical protein
MDDGGREARPAPAGGRVGEWVHVCDCCGEVMEERQCKIVCNRCGYRRDCTDP